MSALTDSHCHFLPGVDDGAAIEGESLGILLQLRKQGVERVAATPHYVNHRDNIPAFLDRRAEALARLSAAAQERGMSLPCVGMAAEVRLEKGLSEVEGLDALRYEGTSCILLELPFVPFKSWMTEEIDNIAYRFSLTPVLAHLDRYEWYSREDWEELLERDDVIFQFNCSAFAEKRAAMKMAIRLIREGRPVLLGSDAHNLDKRPPRFAEAEKTLRAKLRGDYDGFVRRSDSLLAEAFC